MLVWLFNSRAALIRGTGNVRVPANVTIVGTILLAPMSRGLDFGFGGLLVAPVGNCIGAGQRERALRAAWIGAGLSAGLTEAGGLAASFLPHAWLSIFRADPLMLSAGTQ